MDNPNAPWGEEPREATERTEPRPAAEASLAGEPGLRDFTIDELAIVRETADGTWTAVDPAHTEATLRENERQRAHAEAALRLSEEKYRTLFDTIGEGLAIIEMIRDAAGRAIDVTYLEVNEAFGRHTGWPDAGGKRRSEIAPIPDDEWLEGCDRIVRTGKSERWEAYSRNARRWYRCFLSRIGEQGSDLIVLIFENITDRKHRERHQALLTAVTAELAIFDLVPEAQKRLEDIIARHFDLSGWGGAEVGSEPETSAILCGWAPEPEAMGERLLSGELLAACLRGEPARVSDWQNGPPGSRAAVVVPLLQSGACPFAIAVFDRNVRVWRDDEVELLRELAQRIWARLERARAVEALRRSEAQLRALAAQLQEADRRKNEFLAMLGHELRNPLAAIRGGVQLLRSEKARPESKAAALPIVAEQVAHMEHLVEDLLDVTRIVQGRVILRQEKMAVQDALRQALEMVRPQAEPAGFVVEVEAPAAPLEVYGDRVRLTQVLMNIVGNAVKYSGDSRRIAVSAAKEGAAAVVRVRDQGLGISPEFLPRVFEPFEQAKPGITLQSGLGLGLAVVRQLVRLHDGEVEAFSEGDGKGSEFVVRLPLLASVGAI